AEFNVIAIQGLSVPETLVVVVYGNSQYFLRSILPDHILVEERLDFSRRWQLFANGLTRAVLDFFPNDVFAEIYAFIADIYRGPCDQFAYFVLRLVAKRAMQIL